jgi:20S proteasome subunit beta 5
LFYSGSGSTFAYGVLDTHYKYDLSLNEAVDLAIKAIVAAAYRDSASGGLVRGILFYPKII